MATTVNGKMGAVTLAIADTSGLQSALDGKAALAGATFTGPLRVTENANPGFVVEREDGADVIRVNNGGAPGAFHVVNGAFFSMYADDAATQTINIDGSNGNTTIKGALDHDGATVGFYGATPVAQPAANPDTSGAALAALETEVNQLKALLRSVGLMAT